MKMIRLSLPDNAAVDAEKHLDGLRFDTRRDQLPVMTSRNDSAMHSFSGKRILVFEDGFLLAEETAKKLGAVGAIILGPVNTTENALRYLECGVVDAAILDVALETAAVLPLVDALETLSTPFVFALPVNPAMDNRGFAGFVLSHRENDLSVIAEALFRRHDLEQ